MMTRPGGPHLQSVHGGSVGGRRRRFGAILVLGLVLAACSATSEDGSERADVPAQDGGAAGVSAPVPTQSVAPESTATDAPTTTQAPTVTEPPTAAKVSFKSEVLPVLEQNCASCHTAGGPGSSHFPLLTAQDTLENPAYLQAAMTSGAMPPWPASDGQVAFKHDRRLSADDIAKVVAWVDEGATLDVDPATPVVPAPKNQPEPIDRDLVLAGTPYLGSTALVDDYRCQIYDPNVTEPSFVRGYGIEADQTQVVHHALVFIVKAADRAAADRADADTPEVGWNCSGVPRLALQNQIMSWGPGQLPTQLPDGTGLAMDPGDFFVMQIHYHYEEETNDVPADESALVVDLADADEIAAAGGSLDPVELSLYLAPAEIPCSSTESGPLCDRAAAKARLLEVQGFISGLLPELMLDSCGYTVEDFVGMTDGIATGTCEQPATPGQIVSLWGHMHEIGSSYRMTLNPGKPDERILLDIPKWSFEWQLDYYPVDDIVLDDDDIIKVECTWDRAKIDKDAEPRYIMWSEGTEDEMCYSQIITRPVKSA